MDCMEALRQTPDNYYSLSIIDPPYGINESGQTNKSRGKLAVAKDYGNKNWDNKSPDAEYFKQLFRVSKNQIIFGANHFISKIPFDSSCWIVWDKVNGETDFADSELAWTSFKTSVRNFRFQWQGMLQGDMKNKEIRIHPTQKPVKLYDWILKNYAKEGDKILDTHGGSMSSVIACLKGGFNITCFEIDKEYFEKGKKRVDNFLLQGNLFSDYPKIDFIDTSNISKKEFCKKCGSNKLVPFNNNQGCWECGNYQDNN